MTTPKIICSILGWGSPIPTLEVPLEIGIEDEIFDYMIDMPNVKGIEEMEWTEHPCLKILNKSWKHDLTTK